MAQLGNKRRFYFSKRLAGGTVHTWLSGEQSNSFNRTAEAIEVSDKSTEWAQFITGKKGATSEVTVYIDDTDTQQKAALTALHNGDTVNVFIGVLSSELPPSPLSGDAFTAIITAISDTNDNGTVATRTISLTTTGAVTHYPTLS